LHQISERLNVPLADVPVVGDSLRDLQCASRVGARPVLVRTGKGVTTESLLADEESDSALENTLVFNDLAGFTEALLQGDLDAIG